MTFNLIVSKEKSAYIHTYDHNAQGGERSKEIYENVNLSLFDQLFLTTLLCQDQEKGDK